MPEIVLKHSLVFPDSDFEVILENVKSTIPLHSHDFDELNFVFGGTGLHTIDKEKYPLMRGDVFVIHGNQKHGIATPSKLRMINVLFSRNKFKKLSKSFRNIHGFRALFELEPRCRKDHEFKSKLHLDVESLNYFSKLLNMMEDECDNIREGYKITVESIFKLIVVNLCRSYSESKTPESKVLLKISSAINFMENNFAENISVSLLAEKSGMAVSSFHRIFKEIMGCAPIDYLIRLRIEKSAELLAKNNVKVIDVAMATGFENSSYFSRKFKEVMGITPVKYKKK